MNSTDALRERITLILMKYEGWFVSTAEKNISADLTALISEHYYPKEFIKWIGFYSTTLYYRDVDEKWLRTRFDIEGIPTEQYDEYTTDELFNYWKDNERCFG